MDEHDRACNPDWAYCMALAELFPVNPTLQQARDATNQPEYYFYLSHEQHLGLVAVQLENAPHQVKIDWYFLDTWDTIYHTPEGLERFRSELEQRLNRTVVVYKDPNSNDKYYFTSYPVAVKSPKLSLSKKKAKKAKKTKQANQPRRPRNMFIIMRQDESVKIKQLYPDLTVQQISQIVAAKWKAMSEDEKDVWRKAAEKEKEQHAIMYPDYKYSPRKPGEKKKRQSRKASLQLVPAAITAPSGTSSTASPEPMVFDFNNYTRSSTLELTNAMPLDSTMTLDTMMTLGNSIVSDSSMTYATTAMSDAFTPATTTNLMDAYTLARLGEAMSSAAPGSSGSISNGPQDLTAVAGSERDRQVRLQQEFNASNDTGTYDDDSTAFRDGAEDDPCLPEMHEDFY